MNGEARSCSPPFSCRAFLYSGQETGRSTQLGNVERMRAGCHAVDRSMTTNEQAADPVAHSASLNSTRLARQARVVEPSAEYNRQLQTPHVGSVVSDGIQLFLYRRSHSHHSD